MPPFDHAPATSPETSESEAALSGWDPYIVALTGGEASEPRTDASPVAAPESRELSLMAWLKAQTA